MKAVKENKVYKINEEQKDRYLKEGYDICDDEGNILLYSPLKKVPYSSYVELQKENEELKKQLAKATEQKRTGAKAEKAGA